MRRLLIVSNIPTPNNDALFAHVSRRADLELHVIYGGWQESDRVWTLAPDKGYSYEVAPGIHLGRDRTFNPGVFGAIRRANADVAILTGPYTSPLLQTASLVLSRRGTPWLFWGEEFRARRGNPAMQALRRFLVRRLISGYGVLADGSRAVASYRDLGVDPSRLVDFRYHADVDHFAIDESTRAAARREVRSELGIAATTLVFVYFGQLIDRKGLDVLVEAASCLRHDDWVLLLIGDGPKKAELDDQIAAAQIADRVRSIGFVQPVDLPRFLVSADAFVLPSRYDGWGLAVPEAMAAGLPVIASDRVNAAADLVDVGETGYIFPSEDATALHDQMNRFLIDPKKAAEMGSRARAEISKQHPRVGAEHLARIVEAVGEGRPLANGAGR